MLHSRAVKNMSNCCDSNHNCIEELYQDHIKILESIDMLETAIKDYLIDREKVKEFLEFTENFSEPHHKKEEQVLFPKLKEKGIPEENGPIGMMLFEHGIKRSYVDNLRDALLNDAKEAIKSNGNAIVNLMRDHIYKEDNILYPCAKDILSEEEMSEMSEKCLKIKSE